MKHPRPSISFFTFLFIVLLFFIHLPTSYTQDDASFKQCYEPFHCGNMENLMFPLWKEDSPEFCRNEGFELTKCDEDDQPAMNIGGTEFRLIFFNQTGSMTIARGDLWEGICHPSPMTINNIFQGHPFLRFSPSNRNLTFFYDCSSSVAPPRGAGTEWQCTPGSNSVSFYADDIKDGGSYEQFSRLCNGGFTQVKINQSHFEQLHREGKANLGSGGWRVVFDVEYDLAEVFCAKCNRNRSLCDGMSSPRYPMCKRAGSGFNLERKLIIGAFAAAAGILIGISIVCFRRILCIRTATFLRKFTSKDQDIEAFLRNNGTLAPKRYTYSDVKRMTDSFKEKLGKGGFGSVYKGKLPDNHLVAVKVLNTSKGNGQNFINEVASIGRTSHVNIVTLLGFCLEGGKRALVYEFMSNGSLEKFIYQQNTPENNGRRLLTVQNLYQIAIGIARGLEYLHLGCNTRILHFDIKPHNILLHDEFCPKISDFGLAKLCCRTDSIVSMMEARGTIGYIAPEVFCRNIGGVSHKSDVYSYGMMILEMAGGRKNLDVGIHQSSEIYFPHWIHRNLEQDNIKPELLGLLSKEETEIARKMIIVGLWCIQTNPKDRPSISEVKEMLESKEALQIPPKP